MKKLVLVLILAMIVAFTACNGNGDDEPQATPAPTPTPAAAVDNGDDDNGDDAADDVVDAPGIVLHEPRDFGGRVLRISNWWDEPVVMGAFDDPDPFEDAAYMTNRLIWDNARRVEQEFNVVIEHVNVPFDIYLETLTTTVIGGNPFADVVMLDGQHQLSAMGGNLIIPWPNIPGSDVHSVNPLFLMPRTTMDGNVWAVIETGPFASGFGLGVNLDIILADGLPNPVELYEAGEWTWEAMLDIMRRATRSTDGTGVINQWGLGGHLGAGNTGLTSHIIAANDGVQVDSNFNFALDHPNTLYALNFIETIMHEDLWFSDEGVLGGDWNRDMYAGIQEGNVALFTNTTWIPAEAGGIDFQFRWVPFPLGPNNTSGNSWAMGMQQGFALAANSDWDPVDVLIIMEELFAWAHEDPSIIWEAGHYFWMTDVYQDYGCVLRGLHIGVSGNPEIGLGAGGDFSGIIDTIIQAMWNREMSIMEAIEYHRGPAQEILDGVFGG